MIFCANTSLKSLAVAYIVDHGFARSNSTQLHEDKGRILENMVYMELRRRNKDLYYYHEKGECDFIVKNESGMHAYQSCWQMDKRNKDRELNGLLEAMNYFELSHGIIITYNQSDIYKNEGKVIDMVPYYKWASNMS